MKKEEKSGRKKCPSLEPVRTDASLWLPLWMGGIVSTGLNSAILSNCAKIILETATTHLFHTFTTFNEINFAKTLK